MDPVSTALVAALTMGVVGGVKKVGEGVIVNAYEAVMAALKQKFGEDSDVVDAVERLKQKPNSKARQAGIEEEVKASRADTDEEIVAKAQELLAKLKSVPEGQTVVQQIASGSNIAQASHGGTASVNVNQPDEG